ncbi:MAG: aminoacyl-tRNA hydrolase [Pseudomonadota bacterium]|nr:aminoacyl-tRNA hydrolase [Pseudomonadota bacterium]
MPGDSLKVIVGLGNPGPKHDSDRHNAGAIFLHHLCKSYGGSLRGESKFFGEFDSIRIDGHDIKLLLPTTFMNHSGKSVAALCKFFKIEPQHMLVAYDEIDFDVGVTRFKDGGGHGGHNGIRDIISALGGQNGFYRLRIGVGHPGHKSMVANYVLSPPSRSEAQIIMSDIEEAIRVIPKAVAGEWEDAMKLLHTN